jgi:hypothetical protein
MLRESGNRFSEEDMGKRESRAEHDSTQSGCALGFFPARASIVFAAAAVLLLTFAPWGPACAQTPADLQLVLAVDASGSVDQVRFELQKRGYVAAFRHPRVLQAIRSGPNQAIAVTMLQWTGPTLQVPVVGWRLVGDEESAGAFADAIERTPRQLFGGGTSISGAIDYASTLFARSPYRALRRVIDVSGDGSNNRGRPVTLARDEAVISGIGINGLPILALEPDLDRYYYDSVIGGPGAFVIAARDYETFGEAILKKLITEIAADDRRPAIPGHAGDAAGTQTSAGNFGRAAMLSR